MIVSYYKLRIIYYKYTYADMNPLTMLGRNYLQIRNTIYLQTMQKLDKEIYMVNVK